MVSPSKLNHMKRIDLTYKGGGLLTIARFILPSCQNWNRTMHEFHCSTGVRIVSISSMTFIGCWGSRIFFSNTFT